MKRVFGIAIENCERCGGAVKIMACAVVGPLVKQDLPAKKYAVIERPGGF